MYVNIKEVVRLSERSMFRIDIIDEWAAIIAKANITKMHFIKIKIFELFKSIFVLENEIQI